MLVLRNGHQLISDSTPRVRTNLSVLRWAFHILLDAAKEEDVSADGIEQCVTRFDAAIRESIAATTDCLERVRANIRIGNIAWLMLQGIEKKEGANGFRLFRDWGKLDKKLPQYDGILPSDEYHSGFVYLRPQPLETYIRRQSGYRDYTLRKIVKELDLYGALSVNEQGTKQIHISDNHSLPRVYRISVDALRRSAEKY